MVLTVCCVAFALLAVLKMTSLITWSWWWITAPLWGYVVVILLAILAALTIDN